MNDRTPVSYATADEARAYVMRVLSRPPAKAPASVYVIASPTLYGSPAWPAIAEALDTLLPGAGLLTFNDVFPPGRRARRGRQGGAGRRASPARAAAGAPDRRARPRRRGDPPQVGAPRCQQPPVPTRVRRQPRGRGTLALGLPVLGFAPGGMLAWPDVRAHPAAESPPSYATVELDVPPAPPQGVLLPTVGASHRAPASPRPRAPVGRRS